MCQDFSSRLEKYLAPSIEQPESVSAFTDVLQQAMSETANTWLSRVVFQPGLPPPYSSLPSCQALFVAKIGGGWRIIEVEPNGSFGLLEHYGHAAIGSGALWAKAALYPIRNKQLTIEQAKPLAVKVLEEAIDGHAGGLAPPVHVWALEEQGENVVIHPKLQEDREEQARWRYGVDTLNVAFEEALKALQMATEDPGDLASP